MGKGQINDCKAKHSFRSLIHLERLNVKEENSYQLWASVKSVTLLSLSRNIDKPSISTVCRLYTHEKRPFALKSPCLKQIKYNILIQRQQTTANNLLIDIQLAKFHSVKCVQLNNFAEYLSRIWPISAYAVNIEFSQKLCVPALKLWQSLPFYINALSALSGYVNNLLMCKIQMQPCYCWNWGRCLKLPSSLNYVYFGETRYIHLCML